MMSASVILGWGLGFMNIAKAFSSSGSTSYNRPNVITEHDSIDYFELAIFSQYLETSSMSSPLWQSSSSSSSAWLSPSDTVLACHHNNIWLQFPSCSLKTGYTDFGRNRQNPMLFFNLFLLHASLFQDFRREFVVNKLFLSFFPPTKLNSEKK